MVGGRCAGTGPARFRPAAAARPGDPDHYIYVVRNASADTDVGVLWLAILDRAGSKGAYVYQLWIDPAHRRQGHARAAFEAMEPLVADFGAVSIGLHVFGHNSGAQALYRSLGYNVTGVNMHKPLPPAA